MPSSTLLLIFTTSVEPDIISLSTKVNETNGWSNDFNWTGNDENDENEGGEDAVQLVKATEIDANICRLLNVNL